MSKGFASSYRIVLLATGLFACFGAVATRLVWLHVVDRDSLIKNIVQIRTRIDEEKAQRGDILDKNLARLATSRSVIELGVDPSYLRAKDESKWPQLAAMIGMPEAELRRIFLTKYRDTNGDDEKRELIQWAKLRDEVSESQYTQILELGIQGVYGQRKYRRAYPSNELAAHIIGFVSRDEQKPVSGVELYADFYLRGQDGWRVGERDGRNRELAQFRRREVPRSDGYSVVLTIDNRVQDLIEQELKAIAEKFEPVKASIVVSDPRTGFILGMANFPTFNPNEYNKVPKDEYERMKNVAVTDIYEPGSVFKIVPVAAALEEKLVSPQSLFDCTLEKIAYRNRMVDMPAEDHRMGELTVAEIVSHSSNKGAAQLGILLGDEKLEAYARAFGFGSRLGFPIGPESPGLFHPHRKWSATDITRIPMGHTISSTVLQMHMAMTVVANGGTLMRPQIIHRIRDDDGDVIFTASPEKVRTVVSPETARLVAQMLVGVTNKGGTAPEAAIPGFDVAGKTGTTQKLVEATLPSGKTKLVYSNRKHVASFVGFFPAGDPQVAISVIVDEANAKKTPSGVAYGAKVAAPSFKRIGERLIPILDIKPTTPGPVRLRYETAPRPALVATHQGGRR